jgi:hypothetical protein
MPEQLIKFCVTETSHSEQKLRMLFDLIVGKHILYLLRRTTGRHIEFSTRE